MKRRVVFDTNTVLSALLFANGRLSWLREHWRGGGCVPLLSRETAAELMHVLAYPKFQLSVSDRHEVLAEFLPYCEVVEVARKFPVICRDAKGPAVSRPGPERQGRSVDQWGQDCWRWQAKPVS